MKSRIWVFVITLVSITLFNTKDLSAQIWNQAYSEWIGVTSYNRTVIKGAFKYDIHIPTETKQTEDIEYKRWGLQVHVNSDVVNGEGKVFEPLKNISIQLSRVSGGPKLSDFKDESKVVELSRGDQYIIQNADEELEYDDKHQHWTFAFDIIIEGGSYLEYLKSDSQYSLNLTFSLKDRYGNLITDVATSSVNMRIFPTGTPPSGPDFGFEVNANATLNFNTPEHYTRQVENAPNNSWVSVTSKNSGYVLKVKTNNPNFDLIRNDSGISGDATIPVNVVNVEMQSAGNGTSQGAKALSSTTTQTLFIGTKNNNLQKIPVRYFITKTEAEKLATKTSGEYRAILTYTLEPN